MENNSTIEKFLENNETVKTQKSTSIPGILLILTGIICIVLHSIINHSTQSIVSPILILLIIVFLSWGLLKIFIRKTVYKDLPTEQQFKFSEIHYDNNDLNRVVKLVSAGAYDELSALAQSQTQKGLILKIAVLNDRSKCYVQVLNYVPFEYVSSTEVLELTVDQANKLFKAIGK
jgi:hypothetical protein